ncbi:MAG: hypothetical protein AAF696_35820, partial [Bacteroidota bacterium]
IQRAYKTTKTANAILSEAAGVMFKSSIQTAKEIANLYQDAGTKAFSFGKGMIQKTVELSLANQKELVKTSGKAFKEVAQSLRDQAPKVTPKKGKDLKIEDVLND